MCGWATTSTTATGECVYIEPDKSIRIILFVAVFCAVVTTPIALTADWMMLNILSAPTLEETPADAALASVPADSLLADSNGAEMHSIVPVSGSTAGTGTQVRRISRGASQIKSILSMFSNQNIVQEEQKTLTLCKVELMVLAAQLHKYRASLRVDEIEEFNTLWGLDAEGKFLTGAPEVSSLLGRMKGALFKKQDVNVREAVLMDLKRIHDAVRDEACALQETDARKHEIGKKLLFLFQCDLLPGISGKILELKGNRDSSKVKHVSVQAKIAAWAFLLLMNVGMLFYILLFALTQTGPRQNAWFQSFALWLVVEILLVSTAIVFITHILVPSLIMKDITQIKRRLMDNIRDFNDKVHSDQPTDKESAKDSEGVSFNAANYLFVSTRLARQFPDLKESKIIAQFTTPWPRQSYLHVQNVSKKYSKKFSAFTRSASILLIFFVGNFLSVPPACQDIIVQITSTTAIGYLVLIHVQLFEIFPALVILPALVLVVVAHFIIQSSKADAKIKLARLFPSTGKRRRVQPEHLDQSYSIAAEADARTCTEESKDCSEPNHNITPLVSEMAYSVSSESEEEDAEISVAVTTPILSSSSNAHRTRRQSIQTGLDLLHTMHTQQHPQKQQQPPLSQAKLTHHPTNSDYSEGEDCHSSSSDDGSRDYTSTEDEAEAVTAADHNSDSGNGIDSDISSVYSMDDRDKVVVEKVYTANDVESFHRALGTPIAPIQTLPRCNTPARQISPSVSSCILSTTMVDDHINSNTTAQEGEVKPPADSVSSESEYSDQLDPTVYLNRPQSAVPPLRAATVVPVEEGSVSYSYSSSIRTPSEVSSSAYNTLLQENPTLQTTTPTTIYPAPTHLTTTTTATSAASLTKDRIEAHNMKGMKTSSINSHCDDSIRYSISSSNSSGNEEQEVVIVNTEGSSSNTNRSSGSTGSGSMSEIESLHNIS